jgi:hypothetical protein
MEEMGEPGGETGRKDMEQAMKHGQCRSTIKIRIDVAYRDEAGPSGQCNHGQADIQERSAEITTGRIVSQRIWVARVGKSSMGCV